MSKMRTFRLLPRESLQSRDISWRDRYRKSAKTSSETNRMLNQTMATIRPQKWYLKLSNTWQWENLWSPWRSIVKIEMYIRKFTIGLSRSSMITSNIRLSRPISSLSCSSNKPQSLMNRCLLLWLSISCQKWNRAKFWPRDRLTQCMNTSKKHPSV